MKSKQTLFVVFLVVSSFLLCSRVVAQTGTISLNVKEAPLSEVLNGLSVRNNVRFAFDHDLLSTVKVTINISNYTIDQFLTEIGKKYGFKYKLISGTYVIQKAEVVSKPATIVTPPKKKTPEVVQKNEPEPIKEVLPTWCNISGTITDQLTGERLKLCTISFNGKKIGSTNDLGYFSVYILSGEKLRIKISHLGYNSMDKEVLVKDNMVLDIKLTPSDFFLKDEVGAQPRKTLVDFPENNDFISFNPRVTGFFPGLSSSDMMNEFKLLPGFENESSVNSYSVRGTDVSQNLILIDGVPVMEPAMAFNQLSVFNTKYIDQAFVSRGGFGSEYGNTTSGVVDIIGKNGAGEKLRAEVSTNLLDVNAFVGAPIGSKVSVTASIQQSFGDFSPKYIVNGIAPRNSSVQDFSGNSLQIETQDAGLTYRNANVKISFKPQRKQEITLSAMNNFNSQERSVAFPQNSDYSYMITDSWQSAGANIQWMMQNSKYWMNMFSLSGITLQKEKVAGYNNERDTTYNDIISRSQSDSSEVGQLSFSWKSELKKNGITHRFGTGFDMYYVGYKFGNFVTYTTLKQSVTGVNANLETDNYVWTGYYEASTILADKLKIEPSFRTLYDFTNSRFLFLPGFDIDFQTRQNLDIYYSLGSYAQHLHRIQRIDENKNITPIWWLSQSSDNILLSWHNILGVKYQKKGFDLNVEGYMMKVTGNNALVANTSVGQGQSNVGYTNVVGTLQNIGADLFAGYRRGNFYHLFAYTLSESSEKLAGINNSAYFQTSNDRHHRIKFTEQFKYKGWIASMSWRFASGANILQPTGSGSTSFVFDRSNYFSQIDFTSSRQFKLKSGIVNVGFTVLNLTNRENEIDSENFSFQDLSVKSMLLAPSFTPLFYMNFRYH